MRLIIFAMLVGAAAALRTLGELAHPNTDYGVFEIVNTIMLALLIVFTAAILVLNYRADVRARGEA